MAVVFVFVVGFFSLLLLLRKSRTNGRSEKVHTVFLLLLLFRKSRTNGRSEKACVILCETARELKKPEGTLPFYSVTQEVKKRK